MFTLLHSSMYLEQYAEKSNVIVILGQARVNAEHTSFREGSIHSIVVMANYNDATQAQHVVEEELARTGFGEVRLYRFGNVPNWRKFLPNEQGRMFRLAVKGGIVINIFSEDDFDWKDGFDRSGDGV